MLPDDRKDAETVLRLVHELSGFIWPEDAKRRALQIADIRSKENCELRAEIARLKGGPMSNRVTSVVTTPEGNTQLCIALDDGSTIDAVIELEDAQGLVEILQSRLVQWADDTARKLRLPQFEVSDSGVAGAAPAVQLTARIDQIGLVALLMEEETLRKMKHEIDRVLTWRSGSSAKN